MIENYQVLVPSWRLTVPKTVLGVGRFGLRRGHYLLRFNHLGKEIELPVYPKDLSVSWYLKGPFADWKAEEGLAEIAQVNGRQPLLVNIVGCSVAFYRVDDLQVVESLPESVVEEKARQWFQAEGSSREVKFAKGFSQLAEVKEYVRGHYYRLSKFEYPHFTDGSETAWAALNSWKIRIPSQEALYIDDDSLLLLFLWFLMMVPGMVLLWSMRRAVRD